MKKICFVLLVCFLNGCSQAPDYHRPTVGATNEWKAQASIMPDIGQDWWTKFNSTELTDLIQEVKKNNTELKAGFYRIEQARAQVKVARSPLVPEITAKADGALTDNSNSSDKSYGFGASAAYEVDLWKRLGNTAQAAQNRYQAARFDQDALDLVITKDTALNYFRLLALKERLGITRATRNTFRETMAVIQARFDEGAASGLDVARQKGVLANAEATEYALIQQITQTENALAILSGQAPRSYTAQATQNLGALALPPREALQPASLLERRPDIRASEEQLKAANADIGVARAAFFPSLTLGANINTINNLTFSALDLASGITASALVSIFNGGRLQGQLDSVTARQKELAENYHGSVLTAFREAEDALASGNASDVREEKYATALTEAKNAYEIANQRYLNGADDFLILLDTQRNLLQAQESYIQAKLDQFTASLDIFSAMGGGWKSP